MVNTQMVNDFFVSFVREGFQQTLMIPINGPQEKCEDNEQQATKLMVRIVF